ncbi:MAG: pre-peptidase C-terminal domain-containing protein, partial [Planctomycetes bacterium]|nr:pre-peptidase C-terminal domain-containing protein [Planctomycetota bacterium]
AQTGVAPDLFDITANNTRIFHQAFSNYSLSNLQTYGQSTPKTLQIVPFISGISGMPGGEGLFTLSGAGFMEGASTITIAGQTLTDVFNDSRTGDEYGTRNDTYSGLVMPLSLDGPVKLTTAGGFAQITPTYATPVFVDLVGIQSSAAGGTPTDANSPSANPGQTITLTGSGFTNSTLVRFTAEDDSGVTGLVTRTGTPNSDGTTLSVTVPLLAKTGAVTVIGDSTSINLQVVPLVRSVGGSTTTPGTTIVLEGVGFKTAPQVTIDGVAATVQSVQSVTEAGTDQQVIRAVVPNGVSAGLVQVSTAGGLSQIRPAVTITALTDLTPGSDPGDTIAAATDTGLSQNATINVLGQRVGDGAQTTKDVDLYRLDLTAGDRVNIDATRIDSNAYFTVRLFDASGTVLTSDNTSGPNSSPRIRNFAAPATGTYYIGVSDYYNSSYDPNTAGSGVTGNYLGHYSLKAARSAGAISSITGVGTTAASGTPAVASAPSANTGQTVTITGSGFVSGEKIVFTTAGTYDGALTTATVTAASVASDGTSLTVVVPAEAASGTVRLDREGAGAFLQIVPTLTDVDQGVNDAFHNGNLSLVGTGFIEGQVRIRLGGLTVTDVSNSYGPDVYYSNQSNSGLNVDVPSNADYGPVSVTTLGGTSASFALTFNGITATAATGTPANGGQASANPGQTITLTGTGFDATTDVVFKIIDDPGNVSERVVRPTTVAQDGTSLTVVVPADANTGTIGIVGASNNTQPLLQIVPTIVSLDVNGNQSLRIRGTGLIEGATTYNFGSASVVDSGTSNGPNVGYFYAQPNDGADVAIPRTGFGASGNFTVTTPGGTSAPFAFPLASPVVGTLFDGAIDPSGNFYTATSDTIYKFSSTTGNISGSFALPGGGSNNIGLQFVAPSFSLGGVSVPANSLLVFNGAPNPDRVFAIDPVTGATLASMNIGVVNTGNIDLVAGAYDTASGRMFVLDGDPNAVTEISPADGSIIGSFNISPDVYYGGMAINPVNGNIYVVASQTNKVFQYTKAGAAVNEIDLSSLNIDNELCGITINSSGVAFLTSLRGVVYRLAL